MTLIALMAVLSAVAVPNIVGGLPKNRLGGSAREILSILNLAKMAAIKENSDVSVDFNSIDEECIVFVDVPLNPSDPVKWDPGERILRRYTMPSGVDLLAPAFGNVVSFNSRGFADKTGDITVHNSKYGDRKIRVLPSGHCKIL
jgi:type IV fimbrial biogenesis protein FimT